MTFCYISLTLFSFVGNDDIQPVCLPLHGDKEAIRAGLTLKLTGWGLMGSSEGIINKQTAGSQVKYSPFLFENKIGMMITFSRRFSKKA